MPDVHPPSTGEEGEELPRFEPGAEPQQAGKRTFAVVLLASAALTLYVVWPFRAPLFLAAVLAAVLQRPLARVEARLRGRRHLAAALVTLIVFLVIVAPLGAVVAFLAREVTQGLTFLHDQLGVPSVSQLHPGNLPPRLNAWLDRGLSSLPIRREQLQTALAHSSAAVEAHARGALAESGRFAFHSLVMLAALFFFLVDGRRLIESLYRISPLQARHTTEVLREIRRVARASVLGTLGTAVFQGMISAVGFAIFRVPHPLFFGLLTAVAAFIPLIGTTLVWGPAVAFLFLTGHHGQGIGLLAWSLVFVVSAEHLLKPLLLRGQVEMHTGLVFLALLGGLEVFGLLGLIAGPLAMSLFIALVRIYGRDFRRAAELH